MFGRKSRLSPRLAWGLGLTVFALLVVCWPSRQVCLLL